MLVDFRFASVPRPALPIGMAGGPNGPCVGVDIDRIVRVVGLQKGMSDFGKVESERSLIAKGLQ